MKLRRLVLVALAAVASFVAVSSVAPPVSPTVSAETASVASKDACRSIKDPYGAKWRDIKGKCRVVCNSKETRPSADSPYCVCRPGYQRASARAGERGCQKVNPCAALQANERYGAQWKEIKGKCRVVCNSKETRPSAASPYCVCKNGFERASDRPSERGCQKECADWQAKEPNQYTKWKRISGEGGNICRVSCKGVEIRYKAEGDTPGPRHCRCPDGYTRPGTGPLSQRSDSAQRRCVKQKKTDPEQGSANPNYPNKVPFFYFNQTDPRWANTQYPYIAGQSGEGALRLTGCGPTALAMVASSIQQVRGITPVDIANRYGSRFHTSEGTDPAIYPVFAKDYMLASQPLGKSLSEAAVYLKSSSSLVVANVGRGMFTKDGHIIVLANYDKRGKFLVADPKNTKNPKQWFTTKQLQEKANIVRLTGFSPAL